MDFYNYINVESMSQTLQILMQWIEHTAKQSFDNFSWRGYFLWRSSFISQVQPDLTQILIRYLTHFQCVAGIESQECLCTKIQDSNNHCVQGTTTECECNDGFKPDDQLGANMCRGKMFCLVRRIFCTDNFSIMQILTSVDLRIIAFNHKSVKILMEVTSVVATQNL